MNSGLAALLIFGPMLVEARRAHRHEVLQRARGGVEPQGDVYPVMRVAYPLGFVAMLIEGIVRGPARASIVAVGLMVFAAAKLIKWSAILELGSQWTFRVIVVPGDRRVTSGPYRYFRHPNYLGVVGELVGAGVFCGAPIAGAAAVAVFGALVRKRIAVEERAIAQLKT